MLFEMSDVSCIASVKFTWSVQVFSPGMRNKLVRFFLVCFSPKKNPEIVRVTHNIYT